MWPHCTNITMPSYMYQHWMTNTLIRRPRTINIQAIHRHAWIMWLFLCLISCERKGEHHTGIDSYLTMVGWCLYYTACNHLLFLLCNIWHWALPLQLFLGIIIDHWSCTSSEFSNRVCVCSCICLAIHPSIQTHISVTSGRNFLILGMILGMMGYGLGMMPVIFLYGLLSQMHRQTCQFLKEIPMVNIYII